MFLEISDRQTDRVGKKVSGIIDVVLPLTTSPSFAPPVRVAPPPVMPTPSAAAADGPVAGPDILRTPAAGVTIGPYISLYIYISFKGSLYILITLKTY